MIQLEHRHCFVNKSNADSSHISGINMVTDTQHYDREKSLLDHKAPCVSQKEKLPFCKQKLSAIFLSKQIKSYDHRKDLLHTINTILYGLVCIRAFQYAYRKTTL